MHNAASMTAGAPMILIDSVSKHFGQFRALHNVNLQVDRGERHGSSDEPEPGGPAANSWQLSHMRQRCVRQVHHAAAGLAAVHATRRSRPRLQGSGKLRVKPCGHNV